MLTPALLILASFLSPMVIGSALSVFAYFSKKIKAHPLLTSVLISLPLAILAYYFIPKSTYDLVRHQAVGDFFITHRHSLDALAISIKNTPLELLSQLYIYIVTMLGNLDLIQFFVVLLGYSTMFYMLRDYRDRVNLPNKYFIPLTFLTIFGFYVLFFFSGLFHYIATILFALAVYLDYIKKGHSKILAYILYFVILLIHDSMFFSVGLLLFYKLMGNKLSLKTILIPAIGILAFIPVSEAIASIFNLGTLTRVIELYGTYISRNAEMTKLYKGGILVVEITKLLFTLLMLFLARKGPHKALYGFILVLSLCTLAAIPSSIVMIRFVMPIQILGIIPAMDYLKKPHKNNIIIAATMSVLAVFYTAYFVNTLMAHNFGEITGPKLFSNSIDIYNKDGL